MVDVTIYTRQFCGYCTAAKQLLDSKGVDYTEHDATYSPDLRQEMISRANGRSTFPQIFIGDVHVGGCDELMRWNAQGKLDRLLHAGRAQPDGGESCHDSSGRRRPDALRDRSGAQCRRHCEAVVREAVAARRRLRPDAGNDRRRAARPRGPVGGPEGRGERPRRRNGRAACRRSSASISISVRPRSRGPTARSPTARSCSARTASLLHATTRSTCSTSI